MIDTRFAARLAQGLQAANLADEDDPVVLRKSVGILQARMEFGGIGTLSA